jgi:phosphoribosylformimino-5-aminoimidazole carboxamide ribotide isomerase
MKIFPAIDIKNGQCVRLRQGVESDVTVYGLDPAAMAARFEKEGAKYLHVVDLDGAFKGNGQNTKAIERICEAVSIPVEVGGGLRTEDDVKAHFARGVWRVIFGSKAVEDPEFIGHLAKTYGADRIAVSVDAKGNRVTTHGWVNESTIEVIPLVKKLMSLGVTTFIYTDISRDGMLTGPNFDMLQQLNDIPGISLVASGGVSGAADLKKLKEMNLYGAITGKALYEGRVTMEEICDIQE